MNRSRLACVPKPISRLQPVFRRIGVLVTCVISGAFVVPVCGGAEDSDQNAVSAPSATMFRPLLAQEMPSATVSQEHTPAPLDRAKAPSSQLEEIVVSATRRAVRVEDVPISITAFSSADIERNRIENIGDFADRVPGVTFITYLGSESYFSIRGISTIDDSTGTSQPVLLFVDDVVTTGVADAKPDLFDIDHIEVLKGPQGTLFGRNAVGGVISIYTKDPSFRTEAKADVTYGNDNLVELNGMFNTPIIDDKLAGRIVVTTHNRDSYENDVTTQDKVGYENHYTARGKLLFTPTEGVKSVLGFDYLKETNSDVVWVEGNFHPMLDPGLVFGPNLTSQAEPISETRRRIWSLTDRTDWATPVGTVTSITAYRNVHSDSLTAFPSGPAANVIGLITRSDDTQFTEELRLASPIDQRLRWIAGVYYLHSDKARPDRELFNILPGAAFAPPVAKALIFESFIDQNTTTDTPAAFADLTYALLPTLDFSVGARYTSEKKSGHSGLDPATLLNGPPISADYAQTWSAFTPKFTLTYKPTESLMSYATASKGFQSGGFNVQGSTAAGLQTPFKPEYVWNYEVGSKLDGLDHRLQANIAAFIDKYTDLLLVSYTPATQLFLTTNAGAAEMKGVEMDFSALPVPWLTVGASFAYLDGRFTNYVINNGPGTPPTVYTGNRIPFAPPRSVTVNAELHFDSPSLRGSINVGGDYTYRSRMTLDAADDTPDFVRRLTAWNGVVNLHGQWASRSDRWRVLLWGKNMTNTRYTTNAQDISPLIESTAEFANPNNRLLQLVPNPIRSFGITVSATM